MTALLRGEVVSASNPKLDVFIKDDNGAPTAPAQLWFQISQKVTTGSPIQVFPVSGRQAVNVDSALVPGRYVANWTVPNNALIGTWSITWTARHHLASADQFYTEEFEIISAATLQPDALYISVEDVRAAGLNTQPPDDQTILTSIQYWQQIIDRVTRQWFRPIATEFYLDGCGNNTISLPVPIISIETLRINGLNETLDPQRYRVYAGRRLPDDRRNPRIQLVDNWGYDRDIFTAPDRAHRNVFFTGRHNQFVRGVFGYVEEDGSTPLPIKRAMMKLVLRDLASPLVPTPGMVMTPPPLTSGMVQTEWTDGHQISYQTSMVKPRAPGLMGLIDDPEVQMIVKLYRAPIALGAPSHPSFM